jgi:N-acetylglucosaminyldiphosphoundecaprenol N-acetyl-beta-D-mannosaminyltransferase
MQFVDKRVSFCGIEVSVLELDDLLEVMAAAVASRSKMLVFNHNLHSLYLYLTDRTFGALYAKAAITYIDGMPLVWIGRLIGLGLTGANRITFLDSFGKVIQEATRNGWRVFYFGSSDEVVAEGLALMRRQHPKLIISGYHGFVDKSGPESDHVVSLINDFETDILFVGMGMPLQERWLVEHRAKLLVSVALTSGATLDYVTGHAYRPPAWAGSFGLYGILRLFSDPIRLWRRYLVEPIHLIVILATRRMRLSRRNAIE